MPDRLKHSKGSNLIFRWAQKTFKLCSLVFFASLCFTASFAKAFDICEGHFAPFEPSEKQVRMLELALTGSDKSTFSQAVPFYSQHEFTSTHPKADGQDVTISYTRFGSEKGPLGALFISPGFRETALKYTELAYDLLQKGYGPIYAIDHRGQGQSSRLIDDESDFERHKGYVENFDFYANDFARFVEHAVQADGGSLLDSEKLYLYGHSMGGLIATRYLQDHPNPFEKSILTSPMLKIALPPAVVTKIQLFKAGRALSTGTGYFNQFISKAAVFIMKNMGLIKWTDYVHGIVNQWRAEDHPFSQQTFNGEPTNQLTSDPHRYWFQLKIQEQHPANIPISGPTFGWVYQGVLSTTKLFKRGSWKRMLTHAKTNSLSGKEKNLRIAIIQAGRETVVDNRGQEEFCQAFNNKIEGSCHIYRNGFENSEHEPHIERDSIRNSLIDVILDEFS